MTKRNAGRLGGIGFALAVVGFPIFLVFLGVFFDTKTENREAAAVVANGAIAEGMIAEYVPRHDDDDDTTYFAVIEFETADGVEVRGQPKLSYGADRMPATTSDRTVKVTYNKDNPAHFLAEGEGVTSRMKPMVSTAMVRNVAVGSGGLIILGTVLMAAGGLISRKVSRTPAR